MFACNDLIMVRILQPTIVGLYRIFREKVRTLNSQQEKEKNENLNYFARYLRSESSINKS